jgi:hypothetical protein
MPSIARCKVSDCIKSKECFRFMVIPVKEYEPFNYRNNCNEENNYQWFWTIEDSDRDKIVKDDVTDGKEENETGETEEI